VHCAHKRELSQCEAVHHQVLAVRTKSISSDVLDFSQDAALVLLPEYIALAIPRKPRDIEGIHSKIEVEPIHSVLAKLVCLFTVLLRELVVSQAFGT
jgi:hypothetical protein